ncbi:uncharacterized protein LOC131221182 [Magnolia sinica]|uniref:uncharacterized protein LOC131221182 n=1 Tax=Magnolia sinica TaxID=86752 RepID=UPI0026587667|nr:uncharacterized protein LOC131221182 [Magnolia sinica]
MCSSTKDNTACHGVAQINGRPVLQPACNRVASVEGRQNLKKKCPPKSLPPTTTTITNNSKVALTPHKVSPPISPKYKMPLRPVLKKEDPNGLNSSVEKPATPKSNTPKTTMLLRQKSKKLGVVGSGDAGDVSHESLWNFNSFISDAPGSIAVARREQVSLMQAQRKMRIAHYGRTPAKLEGKAAQIDSSLMANATQEGKRCSFITPNSDPLYVAYHDEEWGVPVHDDKMLFELLVLTGAQVGMDWTSILRKRHDFRAAFARFDVEIVANFTERQIASVATDCNMDLNKVRGAVDNANRILQIRREFGSFDKYLWFFVNNKPISTQYKSCRKIPVKTSKSETISKDMIRRGFRLVGPTVVHSFMQAAGLTNDHLITCPRHLQCIALASHHPTVAPAL